MSAQSRFRDLAEFGPTIDATAERLGISATAIEKDYWVSEVLRVLAAEFADNFLLKGGTSLSKGYQLVKRFSEDIDILVLPGRGRGATDKLMKEMAERTAAGIGGTTKTFGGAETGRHRAYEIHYPALHPATELIPTAVLLEMGIRGRDQPRDTVFISSLLGDALNEAGTNLADFSDLNPFEIAVLHPGRTLLEKLVLVHTEAQRLAANPELASDPRIGRHFYDINELVAQDRVRQLLADRDQVEQILEEVAEITSAYFKHVASAFEVRPQNGFAASPAFDLDSDVSSRLRTAYERTMPELYFGTGSLPAWEAICQRVAKNRDLL